MQLRLEKILSALTVFTALAYSLGWIKTLYYFQAFGIGLSSLQFTPQDYLFESWFVLENLVFFLLLSWTIILSKRWWAYGVGVLYLMLPYLSDLAFQHRDHVLAAFLVEHRHSLLKFVPFLLLGTLVVLEWKNRHAWKKQDQFWQLAWPYTKLWAVVYVLVILAWSVSAAKHFGSYDAKRVLSDPGRHLSQVKLHFPDNSPPACLAGSPDRLFMVYATRESLFLWDASGFVLGPGPQNARICEVPRAAVRWIEASKRIELDPGVLF
jgi:hypothetical protein